MVSLIGLTSSVVCCMVIICRPIYGLMIIPQFGHIIQVLTLANMLVG